MANQYLSLGLFIMLLSFFIVLNSLSSFDQSKILTVVDSLSNALSPQYSIDTDALSRKLASEGIARNEGDALDDIQNLFRSVIPDVDAQKNRFGTQLRVAMTRKQFEQALTGQGADGTRFALMLTGLMSAPERAKYQLEIFLSIKNNPLNVLSKDDGAGRTASRTVSGYAQMLEDEGLDPRYFSAGLIKSDPDIVYLVFEKYEPIYLSPVSYSENTGDGQ